MTFLVIGGFNPEGIGEAVGWAAEAKGFDVVIPSHDELDVSNAESIWQFFEKSEHSNTEFTHVVYCAGVQIIGTLDKLLIQEVEYIYRVNVIGFIDVLAHLVRRQTSGRVCAISSDSSRIAMTGSIAYASSKAAMSHAVRCAARELKQDWQITAIAPGIVDGTPLSERIDAQVMEIRQWSKEELLRQEAIRRPFGRRVARAEVATTVLDTITGPATLSGTVIEMNGGI